MRARLLRTSLRIAVCFAVLGLAATAHATPFIYTFTSGSAHITATDSSGTVLNTTIALTGTQVTFNTSPISLTGFQFTAGPTGPIAFTGDLAGVFIALNSVSVIPGGGYTNFFDSGPASPPGTYNYTVGPIAASGSATFSGALTAGPLGFSGSSPSLAGQIQISALNQLVLNGITLATPTLPPVPSIGFLGGKVTVKADIIFTGVPEPATALLVGSGLVGMLVATRRRARGN